MSDVVAIAIVFAVPITAIVSWSKIKLRRLELEAGGGNNRQLEARLAQLERANADLQERLGTVETIVTMDAPVEARTRVRVAAAHAAAVTSAEDDAAALAAAARRAGR